MATVLRDHAESGFNGNALSSAERAFGFLVEGPEPLAVDGREVGHGLPGRMVGLGEVRELLLSPAAGDVVKDAVWRVLVRRARDGGPAWVVGCVGVAAPGLRNVAARAVRGCPAHAFDDVVAEMVAEFVTQLGRIDLERPNVLPRLMVWARKGALQGRAREVAGVELREEMPQRHAVGGEPFLVLAEAVRCRVISADEARLINATRLEGQALRAYAGRAGVPADRLYKRRRAAEARLARAIENGQVSVSLLGEGSISGG
ncbi:hypothetical protein GCM10027589_38580 [Actinocorallia lasiicapitis]